MSLTQVLSVVGLTGVGKSSVSDLHPPLDIHSLMMKFINLLAGKEEVTVGHELLPCTTKITTVVLPYPLDGSRRVVMLDTPGFDDTLEADIEILVQISNWLERS
jgi:predicted GTPase